MLLHLALLNPRFDDSIASNLDPFHPKLARL